MITKATKIGPRPPSDWIGLMGGFFIQDPAEQSMGQRQIPMLLKTWEKHMCWFGYVFPKIGFWMSTLKNTSCFTRLSDNLSCQWWLLTGWLVKIPCLLEGRISGQKSRGAMIRNQANWIDVLESHPHTQYRIHRTGIFTYMKGKCLW